MIESVLEPLFHISSLAKTWTIAEVGTNFVISNSHLEAESISLYESICDESTGLDFGRCSSARFSFTTLDIDLELTGKVFDVSFTFESEPNTPFVVGRFKVVEDKPSPDRRNRDVVMYDALYDVLNTNYASWYNNLTWTGMTLGGFIDSFLSHVGITAETASRAELINASMTVEETLKTNELTGSTILHAVCEVAGCFGVMTRDNKFRFLYLKSGIEGLYPANDLYPAEDLYPVEPAGTLVDGSEYFPPLVYETYKAPSISKLFISESTDSLGTVVGSGDVEYDIVGNFLLFGKGATELSTIGLNILGAISGRVYRPFSVSKMGNLCFELGDPIRMSNDKMSVESYILERTFRGTQGFIDDISAEGVQSYTQNVKSANTTYQQLQSKTAILRQDVDEVSSELTYQLDPTAGEPGGTHNSYAYQTAQEIGAKVETTTFNNALNPNLQGSYAWQTAEAIGAKVDETHGNQTTGFSWELTSSGHSWYKDADEVMKVDGNGLTVRGTVTGSTIIGSEFLVGNALAPRARISSDGDVFILGGNLAMFDAENNNATVSFYANEFELTALEEIDITSEEGKQILYAESDYDAEEDYYIVGVYLGSDDMGGNMVDKLALNASTWIHVGVSSPSIHVGGTGDHGSTDIRIQAQSDSNIVFKYGTTSVTTKTLASILSDVSNAVSTAGSAYDRAGLAQSAAGTAQTTANSAVNTHNTVTVPALQDHGSRILALEQEARSHGWNV